MCNREACLAYFKENKGFDRAFSLMRRKWESLGRTAGTVKLTRCSQQERRAMESLLGRSCPGEDLLFTLAEVERALGETRFQGISLQELLELYFDRPLVSNKEKQADRMERQQAFFRQCRDDFAGKAARDGGYAPAEAWIRRAMEERQYGYHGIVAEWRKNPQEAEKLVKAVGEGLCRLRHLEQDDSVLLAVLAAEISGNPHFLDRGTTGGLLFTQALCCGTEADFPATAGEYAALYGENGVEMDQVSSTVAAFGIHLVKSDGSLHPAYEGFLRQGEACVIMAANLDHVRGAYGDRTSVFVVENEMVFTYLCDRVRSRTPSAALVCTSGQPRKAALHLLDLLAASGAQLYYAGDLDPDGLRIADRLAERYGEKLKLWHMAPEDYRKAVSHERIGQRGLAKMEKLRSPLLLETAKCIAEKGLAGYQERLLEEMASDILAADR